MAVSTRGTWNNGCRRFYAWELLKQASYGIRNVDFPGFGAIVSVYVAKILECCTDHTIYLVWFEFLRATATRHTNKHQWTPVAEAS